VQITGAALDTIINTCNNETVNQFVRESVVFAKMGPDHKAWIIDRLSSMGYYVGMCGDGTNDCSALKTAHIGVSLSANESSMGMT